MTSPLQADYFVDKLRALHLRLRDGIRRQVTARTVEDLSGVAAARDGDTIYHIDERGEEILLDYCAAWGRERSFVLVAEGIAGDGRQVFPAGADPTMAEFYLIVDPIDGTRGLMYGKRSAWLLTAIAPARADGVLPTLRDITVAMQTELPTARAYLSDLLWAVAGQGAHAETHNLLTGAVSPAVLRPSRAPGLEHGFAAIAKFFPGGKELAARLEERLYLELMGPPLDGNPQVFDDQYICSGGQFYELMAGHDRFLADLRPTFHGVQAAGGAYPAPLLCCHPYDVCTELIARELGVIITDERGADLDYPLDIRADVGWIGYANEAIRRKVEPVLLRLLGELERLPRAARL